MTTNQLIGSAEACALLGNINRSTLTRWVKAGRLTPAGQLPGESGALLFDRAEVERLRLELGKTDKSVSA